jgi:hypothetical protein
MWNAHDLFYGFPIVLVEVLSTVVIQAVRSEIFLDVPMDLLGGAERGDRDLRLAISRLDDAIAIFRRRRYDDSDEKIPPLILRIILFE